VTAGEVDTRVGLAYRETLQARLDEQNAGTRLLPKMLMIFAGISLLIAAIGQYAVVAFNMRRRVREFGIRLALGASSRTVTGSNGVMNVRTARRSTGGEAMIERSRTPVSASCKVRGIGVADKVNTWTSARRVLSFSL